MKKCLFCTALMLFALLTGCMADPFQEEFLTYVNEEMRPYGGIETEALQYLNDMAGEDFDYHTFYQTMTEEVIPRIEEVAAGVANIEPEHEELKEVHQIYLEGINLQLEAMKTTVEGIESGNEEMIERGSKMQIQATEIVHEYTEQMKELGKKYNMEYELVESEK